MEVEFPYLYDWQKPVFEAVSADTKGLMYVVKARRQCGKSIVAELLLILFALKRKSISCLVEPTQSQCRRVFKQLLSAAGGIGPLIKSANATLLEIEWNNGSQTIFKSAEQRENLRGITISYGLLVIDEAAFIQKDIFEILYPTVDATASPVLMISTPLFCSGEFYERFTRGVEGDANISVFDWATYDTSALLPPEKLEYYRQTISPLKFQSEYLGQFIKEGSYLFGDITLCVDNNYYGKPAVCAGIDWGAGGTDSTAVVLLDEDKRCLDIKRYNDIDPVDLVDALAEFLNGHKELAVVQVEMNSIGEVYFSMLKRKVRGGLLRKFLTTNDSKRRVIETLITAFQTRDLTILNDAEMIKQLQHYAAEKTQGGKITYNGADGVHDDCVIALALAYDANSEKGNKFRIGFA